MHAEQVCGVGPEPFDGPSRPSREFGELVQAVFVRVFCDNVLSLLEGKGGPVELDGLLDQAHQVHLDPAKFFVVKRMMLELVPPNPGTERAIDPGEQVEIESGGDTTRVI